MRLPPALVAVPLVFILSSGCSPSSAKQEAKPLASQTPTASAPTGKVWKSEPPADIPFEPSHDITGLEFSDEHASYTDADTWYPSWGADDVLYSPYTDGSVTDSSGKAVEIWSTETNAGLGKAVTGRATIEGNDPTKLKVTSVAIVRAPAQPYNGRYPSASLMYKGIWYVGTYSLNDLEVPACGNFCVLGPMVGFHWSKDKGRTWQAPPSSVTPAHPLFGETALDSARVKLSAAHFVDFGKEMEHSPDGKAYLVGHGSVTPGSHNGWISGDQIYLARVTPSPETINDVRAWEFYAGRDGQGQPRWSKSFADIRPIIEWKDRLGNVAITYNAPLKKYILFTTHGWPSIGYFDTIVLEADQLTGPWRLVTYMKDFGPQGYFVNLPSKFISADGRTAWLAYAANFWPTLREKPELANPAGSRYALNLHKIRLLP